MDLFDRKPHFKEEQLLVKLEAADILLQDIDDTLVYGMENDRENRPLYISSRLLMDDYRDVLEIEVLKIGKLHDQMARLAGDADETVSLKAFENWVEMGLGCIDMLLHKLSALSQLLRLSDQVRAG